MFINYYIFFFLFKGTNDHVRRFKTLLFTNNTIELNSSKIMNDKLQDIGSSLTKLNHPKLEYEDLNHKKATLVTTNDNDDHRTVIARHIFHADIKQKFTRWIRETPV